MGNGAVSYVEKPTQITSMILEDGTKTTLSSDNNIDAFLFNYQGFLLIENNVLVSGTEHVTGVTGLGKTVGEFTELFTAKDIFGVTSCDGTTSYIFLNSKENLIGFGYFNKIGEKINENDQTIIRTPQQLPGISNVTQIAGGNGFFVIVKEDGSVWGIGDNSNGILGRWIGVDRKVTNSRYQNPEIWVECPELEI